MMKQSFKKSLAALLAAVMLMLTLAACGDDEGSPTSNGSGSNGSNSNGGSVSTETVFVPEYISMPEEISSMYNAAFSDGWLYFANQEETVSEPYLIYVGDMGGMVPYAREGIAYASSDTVAVRAFAVGDEDDAAEGGLGEGMVLDENGQEIPERLPMPEDGVIPDGYIETRDYSYENKLCRVKVDGTGYEELSGYLPPESAQSDDPNVYHNINRLSVDALGNIWTLENVYSYSDGESMELYFVRKLDSTGAELSVIDATDLKDKVDQDYFYISAFESDDEGNVYIASDMNIFVFDSQGAMKFELTVDNWVQSLVATKDGEVGVSTYGERGYEIWMIDSQKMDWGEKYEIKSYASNTLRGTGEYDFYYYDQNNLYGYKLADGTEDKLVNWLDSDVNANYGLNSVVIDTDGSIMCMTSNESYSPDGEYLGRTYEMAKLVPTPASEVPVKTVLTLATYYLDWNLRAEILDFNKTSSTHRIRVTDYSEYDDYRSENQEDWNAGLTKLNTEIISGNIPDIIAGNSLPIQNYINKGIMEDLYPFINSDPDYSIDQLVEQVVRASEVEGKLYQISSGFYVQTAVGNPGVVGDKMGWTIDEAMEILNKAPAGATLFGQYYTKADMFQMLFMFDMDSFIDWTTGKCSFDSEDFIKLLEFANTFPSEYNWETAENIPDYQLARDGLLIAQQVHLSGFDNGLSQYKTIFGGEITFKGFPCSDANGHVMMLSDGIGISTSCKDKDAAWQFIRRILSEEYTAQYGWTFPINKAAMDNAIEKALTVETYIDPETGEERPVSYGSMMYEDGFEVEMLPPTQEEIDQIMELINSIDKVINYDTELVQMIAEEATPFFEGQKSSKEVADIIQSKMFLYISEQM